MRKQRLAQPGGFDNPRPPRSIDNPGAGSERLPYANWQHDLKWLPLKGVQLWPAFFLLTSSGRSCWGLIEVFWRLRVNLPPSERARAWNQHPKPDTPALSSLPALPSATHLQNPDLPRKSNYYCAFWPTQRSSRSVDSAPLSALQLSPIRGE